MLYLYPSQVDIVGNRCKQGPVGFQGVTVGGRKACKGNGLPIPEGLEIEIGDLFSSFGNQRQEKIPHSFERMFTM